MAVLDGPTTGRGRRWLSHLLVIVLVLLAGGLPTSLGEGASWAGDEMVLNLVAGVLLLGRHRAPRLVLAAELVLVVVSLPLHLLNSGTSVAVAFATNAVVVRLTSRQAVALTTAGIATAMLAAAFVAGDPSPQYVLVILLGGAVGEAIRTQRAHVAAITERAERAERTREAVARQRVAEDRLVIARDLHDVVAHQIAVINLHAGVASSALRTRPDDAEESLAVIRRASRTVLTEIGDLLAALRDPDAVDSGPPGLVQLDDVVRALASDGLAVTVRTTGDARDLPSTVDVAALRVVQEALANAHKHGTEHRAHVLLDYLPHALRVTVTNPVTPFPTAETIGTRQGLVGMGERVESVRGTLTYGRTDGSTWRLVADLPFPPDAAEPDPQQERA